MYKRDVSEGDSGERSLVCDEAGWFTREWRVRATPPSGSPGVVCVLQGPMSNGTHVEFPVDPHTRVCQAKPKVN